MCRLLFKGDKGLQGNEGKRVSTFEAFMVSLASRVGTGNLRTRYRLIKGQPFEMLQPSIVLKAKVREPKVSRGAYS